MNPGFIQILTLVLLAIFYIAYFIKAFNLKRSGITVNLLGKGDKPKAALFIEQFLRVVTLSGAAIQFGSAVFMGFVWSLPTVIHIGIVGIVLMIIGNLFFIVAMLTMRENWRAGFDRKQNTNLVTRGVYNISRNPAFVGFDLIYFGCALAFPNAINIIVTVVAVALFHFQILGEEKYCEEAFGNEYLEYKRKVRRYI